MTPISEERFKRYLESEQGFEFLDAKVAEAASAGGSPRDARGLRALKAVAAIEAGLSPEVAARHLDWKDFEELCAFVLRIKGFAVTTDLRFRKPTAQIDILARSSAFSIAVDCKHWARAKGGGALSEVVEKQRRRAALVRARMPEVEPLAVVVLSLAEERARFADGAAVVPIRTLGDFLDNFLSFAEYLDFL